ncbi:hypothetical protein R6Q57_028510 [Mikania cordata]
MLIARYQARRGETYELHIDAQQLSGTRCLTPKEPTTMGEASLGPEAKTAKSTIIINTPTNKLLAGYMAHGFQTKGTLLGQKLDFARAGMPEIGKIWPVLETRTPMNHNERDKEVTSLIMMNFNGGVLILGIVNRTHHARWIHMYGRSKLVFEFDC